MSSREELSCGTDGENQNSTLLLLSVPTMRRGWNEGGRYVRDYPTDVYFANNLG